MKKTVSTPIAIVLVACGGFVGTYARVALADAAGPHANIIGPIVLPWVWPLVFVNLVGALGLGLLNGIKRDGELAHMSLLIGTGFFGAFTTYSTFSDGTVVFRPFLAGLSWALLLILLGVCTAAAGFFAGRALRSAISGPPVDQENKKGGAS